ncbi:MAG: TnpV protein [Lachnospiraceae bacterium]|nr:TnpV protein [Lachnospiraceae bacterium]
MELTYHWEGDYLIPDLQLSDTTHYHIGKYGHLRKTFLKEHHPAIYSEMLLSESLYRHLSDIEETCQERLDRMIPQMAKREGVTEELKRIDQMRWVRAMNSIKHRVEEIILHELVYTL